MVRALKQPEFSRMGRQDLIDYCKALRNVLSEASPVQWIDENTPTVAAEWEHRAEQVLNNTE